MADAVVELEDIWLRRNGQWVLEAVNLAVEKGDFFAILGPNGGGKTTLLRVILGLARPQRGNVKVFDSNPGEVRGRLGYVPQFRTFDFGYPITVYEMVLSGRLGHIGGLRRAYRDEDETAAHEALQIMGIGALADRNIANLSGGEQQRAIIARALVGRPDVLLLDEPTVYVDIPTENRFLDILDRLKDRMTIVLVTHDIGVISTHVTKVACLNRRLFTHGTNEITEDMLAGAYPCPVELVAHGIPHRVLRKHEEAER